MSLVDDPVTVDSREDEPTDIGMELLLEALLSLRKGDFSVRLPATWVGIEGKVADTFNDVMEQLEEMSNEVDRISRVVGKEGENRG